MHGFVYEGIRQYICRSYSQASWNRIADKLGIDVEKFEIRIRYNSPTLAELCKATCEELDVDDTQFTYELGRSFYEYFKRQGFQTVIQMLGRNVETFINSLDNLHESLRPNFPDMEAPSCSCLNVSSTGVTVEYKSDHHGLVQVFIGILSEICKQVYEIELNIKVLKLDESVKGTVAIIRLIFDNKAQIEPIDRTSYGVPVRVFFEAFPFHLIFNRGMQLINVGRSIANAINGVAGQLVTDVFSLVRPNIEFTWDEVILHRKNIFYLVSKQCSSPAVDYPGQKSNLSGARFLKLRGQMKYITEWDTLAFIGSPLMKDVDAMWEVGLFLNDLSMHDSSREMVLAGEQQAAELKLAIEQESEKRQRLQDNLRKIDEEVKKTDELLYQLIPQAVADRLRSGVSAIDTCETFDDATILYSDVVGFTAICSHLSPLEVVKLLNTLYSVFDEVTEKHEVYKVETIGDAYLVASGCPIRTTYHAEFIAETSLDMIEAAKQIKLDLIKLPRQTCLQIRVGLHTGSVVAGVVGVKMPRYCLFGSTVAIAEVMEATSSAQRIQVSETTYKKLSVHPCYQLFLKGKVDLKDGESLTTYWLAGKLAPSDLNHQAVDGDDLHDRLRIERARLAQLNVASGQRHGAGGDESKKSDASY